MPIIQIHIISFQAVWCQTAVRSRGVSSATHSSICWQSIQTTYTTARPSGTNAIKHFCHIWWGRKSRVGFWCLLLDPVLFCWHCYTAIHSTTPHPMNRARGWYDAVTLLYDLCSCLTFFDFNWEGPCTVHLQMGTSKSSQNLGSGPREWLQKMFYDIVSRAFKFPSACVCHIEYPDYF